MSRRTSPDSRRTWQGNTAVNRVRARQPTVQQTARAQSSRSRSRSRSADAGHSSGQSDADVLSLKAPSDEELRSASPALTQPTQPMASTSADLSTSSTSHDYDTSAALREIFRLLDTTTCPPQQSANVKSKKPLSRVDRERLIPQAAQRLPTGSLVLENMEAEFQKAKQHNYFLNPANMESRFSSLAAVPYDADTGGLSVEAPKLEASSKALGMKEVSVTFTAKQMTDFSTLVRRLLGCLNYQDLAITAMIKLLQQLFASTSAPEEELKKAATALFTAISRANNDAVAHAVTSLINVESARRRAALKTSDQLLPYRQDALMEEPVLSSKLFNDKPESIKAEIYRDMQNKALVDMSKKASGDKRQPAQPRRGRQDKKYKKPRDTTSSGWSRAKSVTKAKSTFQPKRKFAAKEDNATAKRPRFSSYRPPKRSR